MRNWLGHDIVEGAIVFRGGRQGDSSSFRVGQVDGIDEAKGKARVQWHWIPGSRYIWDSDQFKYPSEDPNRYTVRGPSKAHTQRTSYPVDDLVRIADDTLEYLQKRHKMIEAAIYFKIRSDDYEHFELDFLSGNVPDVP